MARATRAGLAGRVVVLDVSALGAARSLASEGAVVVLVGTDPAALGEAAGAIEADGGRVAVVVGSLDDDATTGALVEMLDELFGQAG